MAKKVAALLSFAAAFAFGVLWVLLMLAAKPDTFNNLASTWESFLFAISPASSRTWIYIFLVISIAISLTCAVLLFIGKNTKPVLVLVALHSATAYVIYTWGFSLLLATPLLLANRLLDDDSQ